MAGWWFCSVMTSYISVRIRRCCQRYLPLGTKRGVCRRISFRAACLSECAQTRPSDRRNHLAPLRNLQLLLRRHSAIGTRAATADRWCSTPSRCAASMRLSADASGLIKCHWEVDGPVHEWLSETPVLDWHD